MSEVNENQECCPRFEPEPWHEKTFQWDKRKFVKDKVFTLFYMPVNFGKVITRLIAKVEKNQAQTPDYLCLSDHTSKFNMDIYLAVNKEIDGADNVSLSGKYFSKAYEGNFKETGNWGKDFNATLDARGLKTKKLYMWYTTCPKCAKKYGKNYVVFVGELSD
jgi:hypothetical protein